MVDTTGFVTSLVLNFGIALVAFALFVTWKPKYPCGTEPPSIPHGNFGWFPKVMRMTDAEVIETAGLDGLMLIKFFELCMQLFGIFCILGVGVILPVNYTSSNGISDAFDKMSLANIPDGSRLYWVHLVIAYVFCLTFYYLAYHTWQDYLNLRHQFLSKWTSLGGNHTILVHNLPAEIRSDATLLAYFQRIYPGQVRSARMAKDLNMAHTETNELDTLDENVLARTAVEAELEHNVAAWEKILGDANIPEEKRERPQKALKCFCCSKTDAIDHNYGELERLNKLIADKKNEFNGKDGFGADGAAVPTLLSGFVTFHSAVSAASASAFVYDTHPYSFEVKMAPECRDIYWPNLNMTHVERGIRTMAYDALTLGLVFFWMIPVAIVQAFTNLQGLADKYSWLSGVNDIPSVILGFIQGYLPSLVIVIFLIIVPMILLAWSREQGIESHSWMQKSLMQKYFIFIVVNMFFGAIIGSSIFSNMTALFSDISSVPTVLGQTIPASANYFVNYIALQTFAGFPLQMAQAGRLIVGGIKKKYLALTPREFEAAEAPPAIGYGAEYCNQLFIFLIAITYAFISPIVIPFAAIYFFLGWIVFKYQIVHVFVQPFESGGSFWPAVYSKMSTCLIIAQLSLVGLFGLKKVAAQAVLVVPLPFLTLIFDRFIHTAVKTKLKGLPLEQMVEIDAASQVLLASQSSGDSAPLLSAGQKSLSKSLNSFSDKETVTIHAEPAEEKFNNGDRHANDAYIHDKLAIDGTNLAEEGLAAVGFPYAPDQQDRAFVEGDLAAYIQPELTPLVPTRIEVNRADQYLSASLSKSIRIESGGHGYGTARSSSAEDIGASSKQDQMA